MSTRWEERAVPVLTALSESEDHYVREGILMVGHGQGKASLGIALTEDAIHDTVLQLGDLGCVEFSDVSYNSRGATITGLRVTGRGLQVLGQWPRFEAIISPGTLAAVIDRLAQYATPEDTQPMKRAAGVVRRIGAAGLRSAAIGVGVQVAKGALGIP